MSEHMGLLASYFIGDHRRQEALLNRAVAAAGEIDDTAYSEFRSGILKHIGMEEKILLPAMKRLQNGARHQFVVPLRLEHGAFAALLVPPVRRKIAAVFRAMMIRHNELEEGENGLYAECEQLIGSQVQEFMIRVHSFPDVPVMPHVLNPNVLDVTRRALARAGYDFDKIEI
jgi:hypothetical protein